MKKSILIAAAVMLAGISHGQMFAQMFGQSFTPLTLGPVAWYKGDGNALDSSGRGYNATWVGTPSYRTCTNGTGFDFSGATNTYLRSTIPGLTNNFTICAWVELDRLVSPITPLFFKADATRSTASDFSWVLRITTNGNMEFRYFVGAVGTTRTLTTGVSSNVCRHIVIAATDSTVSLYLNGETAATDSFASANNTDSLFIGAYALAALGILDSFLDGAMDDVLIFNRALTPAEITQLYNWRQP
jgi:hypothetical protein